MHLLSSRPIHQSPQLHNIWRLFSLLRQMNPNPNSTPSGSNGGRRQSLPPSNFPVPELASSYSTNTNHIKKLGRHETRVSAEEASGRPIQPKFLCDSTPSYDEEFPPLSASIGYNSKNKRTKIGTRRTHVELNPDEEASNSSPHRTHVKLNPDKEASNSSFLTREMIPSECISHQKDGSPLPTCFGRKDTVLFLDKREMIDKNKQKDFSGERNPHSSKNSTVAASFDICLRRSRKNHSIKSYFKSNGLEQPDVLECSEEFNELENPKGGSIELLRPGMILLRHYLTEVDQIEIVKKCRDLGVGPGGFYQPGYNDGAKLRLKMMCLGLDWDPQTRKYLQTRLADGSRPHDIPQDFELLVKRAILDSHAFIKDATHVSNVATILPSMSPDICIVNFYTKTGRLGLHQDRDESSKSLRAGLPVVSFSIGDSAEFLYGDERDVDKAEKVVLESGDVLIFGGKSRHIFHGVSSIIPHSAPAFLVETTNIRPGRLNLTFRQF